MFAESDTAYVAHGSFQKTLYRDEGSNIVRSEDTLRLPVRAALQKNAMNEYDAQAILGDSVGFDIMMSSSYNTASTHVSVLNPSGEELEDVQLIRLRDRVTVRPFVVDQLGDYLLRLSKPVQTEVTLYVNYQMNDGNYPTRETAIRFDDLRQLGGTHPPGIHAVYGTLNPLPDVVVVDWSAESVVPNLETDVKHESSSVRIESTPDGQSVLFLETGDNPDSPSRIGGGLIIDYDSTTGRVGISSQPDQLVTIEIQSASGWFTGPRPPQIDAGTFNVYSPHKVFLLDYLLGGDVGGGYREIDLGEILPPGKTLAELEEDLAFAGAYRNRPGGLTDIAIRVDNDPAISNQGFAGATGALAKLKLNAPVDVTHLLIRYRAETTNGGDFNEQTITNRVYISIDGGATYPHIFAVFPECGEAICETLVPLPPDRRLIDGIAFTSNAAYTRFSLESVMGYRDTDLEMWYQVTLAPGESLQLRDGKAKAWYDDEGDLITDASQPVTNTTNEVVTFYLKNELSTANPLQGYSFLATRYTAPTPSPVTLSLLASSPSTVQIDCKGPSISVPVPWMIFTSKAGTRT